MVHMLPRVLEEPVSSGNTLQCPEAVKRSYFAVNASGMVRAEVNRISSHSHHGGTWSWLWGAGGALGHLWYLSSGCTALPFNICRKGEGEAAFIGPKEGKWHKLHEHIWWTHIKGRAALEKLSGHLGVYYLAQGHLSCTLKVSQHLSCYQPYNQNLADLLKLWIKQLVGKHHRPDPKISLRQTRRWSGFNPP